MRLFLLVLTLLVSGASPPTRPRVPEGAAAPKATVYVFLAPDCPICQAAVLPLRELAARYTPQGIGFIGVFPDQTLTPADLKRFGTTYQLSFPLQPDGGHQLTRRFGATITPEVVVADAQGRTLYQGRIDDSFARIGQRRTIVRHHELADALAAVVAGKPIAVTRTEAVGCLIEP